MRASLRRSIITLICAILALTSLTTAWILSNDNPRGRYVQVDFANEAALRITANSLRVSLYTMNETTRTYELNEDGPTLSGLVPNETVPFRLRFQNVSGTSQPVTVTMTGITADDAAILDKMYVGMSGGYGYVNSTYVDTIVPDRIFVCMSDAAERNGTYTLTLYDEVYIPPTGENGYVELNGYFWFHRSATTALADTQLTIEHFRVIVG